MSSEHPIVGVTKDLETGEWEAFPVCSPCHQDPQHRKVKLKMHFFPREMKKIAVARAGSLDIGGGGR
jgi:hypothetical protein